MDNSGILADIALKDSPRNVPRPRGRPPAWLARHARKQAEEKRSSSDGGNSGGSSGGTPLPSYVSLRLEDCPTRKRRSQVNSNLRG
jgi:hypothetical protein